MERLKVLFALLLAWLSVGGAWAEEETFNTIWVKSESTSANILFEKKNASKYPDESSKVYVKLYAKGTMTITPKPVSRSLKFTMHLPLIKVLAIIIMPNLLLN